MPTMNDGMSTYTKARFQATPQGMQSHIPRVGFTQLLSLQLKCLQLALLIS